MFSQKETVFHSDSTGLAEQLSWAMLGYPQESPPGFGTSKRRRLT
jgi:hypothetical protein